MVPRSLLIQVHPCRLSRRATPESQVTLSCEGNARGDDATTENESRDRAADPFNESTHPVGQTHLNSPVTSMCVSGVCVSAVGYSNGTVQIQPGVLLENTVVKRL